MLLSKVIIFGSVVAAIAPLESESICGVTSTVYVTVTATQTTEAIEAASTGTSSALKLGASYPSESPLKEALTDITATSTDFHTITNVFSVLPATIASVSTDQSPFSFAEHSGTTIWLGGKTPPTTESLVVETTAVTVKPVPIRSDAPSAEAPTTTSFSTLSLTSVTSEVFTETVTESSSSPVASAKPFTGVGTYGWNSTLTTLVKVVAGAKGSGQALPSSFLPGITHGSPTLGTGRPSAGLHTSAAASGPLAERQVGAIVVVTIGGVVVSWTNSYDGSVPTPTSEVVVSSASFLNALPPTTPTTTLAAYPWDQPSMIGPLQSSKPVAPEASTPLQSSSTELALTSTSTIEGNSATTPSTTAAVYSWDLPSSSTLTQVTPPAELTLSLVSVTPTALSSKPTKSSSIPSFDSQPGVPTLQPSFVASLMSQVPQPVGTTTSGSASTAPFMNTSSTSSTAAAPTSSCSSTARFTIGFDDLPHFSTGPNDVDIPPIFNPYQKLYWEEHFGYVPPPTDPFPPVSPPQLAVYRVDNNTDVDADPDSGDESIGEFGAGPRSSDSAYWIDAFSAYLGCSNAGPGDCTISINGYDAVSSTRIVNQTVTQPPCPGLKNCTLAMVEFLPGFKNLSGIQILAAVNDRLVTWYMDDLQLGWSNNTCAAATERASGE